jgi:hypothetical protein
MVLSMTTVSNFEFMLVFTIVARRSIFIGMNFLASSIQANSSHCEFTRPSVNLHFE